MFQIKSKLEKDFPKFRKSIKPDTFFMTGLAHDMVRIVKEEIRRELFGNKMSRRTKDLIKSWHYKSVGNEIHLWSDDPAMTGEEEPKEEEEPEEEEPEEEEPEEEPEVEEESDEDIPNDVAKRIVIKPTGDIEVRNVTAKRLENGDWLFPPHQKSAFLERAHKRIMKLIGKRLFDGLHVTQG